MCLAPPSQLPTASSICEPLRPQTLELEWERLRMAATTLPQLLQIRFSLGFFFARIRAASPPQIERLLANLFFALSTNCTEKAMRPSTGGAATWLVAFLSAPSRIFLSSTSSSSNFSKAACNLDSHGRTSAVLVGCASTARLALRTIFPGSRKQKTFVRAMHRSRRMSSSCSATPPKVARSCPSPSVTRVLSRQLPAAPVAPETFGGPLSRAATCAASSGPMSLSQSDRTDSVSLRCCNHACENLRHQNTPP